MDLRTLRAAEAFAADAAAAIQVSGLAGASNNWALAPSRTSTGRPILANDPHLSPALPSHWYFAHVRTPAWAMTGACMPSQPVVSCGHNERVAWGITAGHVDNTDLYLERIGPDRASVLEDGRHVPCTVHEERIRVKRAPDVVERVLVTPRGPIVSPVLGGDDAALSLRGTWMARRPFTAYGVFRSKSAEEARRLYASYPFLSESRVFADVDGHIAWQMIGDAPVRKKSNGTLPTPGWDTSLGWKEAPRPFDELPRRVDPPEGFVASANQAPGKSDVTTPGFLGADWLDGQRYARIVESLEARKDWDVASTMKLQVDRTTVLWRTLREPLLTALRDHARGDLADVLELLEAWDGVMSAQSSAASVYALLFAEMTVRATRAKAPRSWRVVLGEGFNVVLPHSHMAVRRVHRRACSSNSPTWFHLYVAVGQDDVEALTEDDAHSTWRCRHVGHIARLPSSSAARAAWFTPRSWLGSEIADALSHVVDELSRRAGRRPDAWAWGKVRPLVLIHAVGSKPPLGRVFNRGPLTIGGDGSTIPQGSVDPADPYANPLGIPNMRAVIDVGNWEASRWVLRRRASTATPSRPTTTTSCPSGSEVRAYPSPGHPRASTPVPA